MPTRVLLPNKLRYFLYNSPKNSELKKHPSYSSYYVMKKFIYLTFLGRIFDTLFSINPLCVDKCCEYIVIQICKLFGLFDNF
jgi:hypothetical protein